MWFNCEVKMPRATTNQVNNSCINIDGEEWRDVAGYENIYQVSSAGRVRHLSTMMIEVSSSGEVISSRKTKEYILKQCYLLSDTNFLPVITLNSILTP